MAVPTLSRSEDVTTSVVSCLGDSITNGYPYSGTEHTYPAQLQARLDEAYSADSYEVINHGVDGYRADQVLADLQDHNWLAEDPDLVLLMVGGAVISLYNSRLESDLTGVHLWITSNWDDFYDTATGQARESLMHDSVHPNADGYLVMAENWFGAIESLVQQHEAYLPLVLRDHQ